MTIHKSEYPLAQSPGPDRPNPTPGPELPSVEPSPVPPVTDPGTAVQPVIA